MMEAGKMVLYLIFYMNYNGKDTMAGLDKLFSVHSDKLKQQFKFKCKEWGEDLFWISTPVPADYTILL